MSKRQVLFIPLLSGISFSLYYFYQRYIKKYDKKIICDTSYQVYRQIKKEFDSNVKIVKKFKFKPFNRITIQNYKSNIHFHNIDDISTFTLNKIKNVLNEITINDIDSLREEFEYLNKPNHRIVIINSRTYHHLSKEVLSQYHKKNTKIIILENETLLQYLKIDHQSNNKVYVYYPPKLPFILSSPELCDQNINQYYIKNPIELSIKYGLYRNVYVIDNDAPYILDKKVISLCETNKEMIDNNLKRKGRHLFIYLPEWSYINEDIIENFLYEKSAYFTSVNITTSKEFAKTHNLYESNLVIDCIPQVFIIDNTKEQKNTYNLTYFKLDENYKKYLNKELPQCNINGSLSRKMFTYVKDINNESFQKEIIEDKNCKEYILEIYKDNCPACFILGKMFDHLSHKFNKHNITGMKLLRINIDDNDIPLLGEFNATPTFLYLRKNDKGQIEYICPLQKENFISKLKTLSKTDLSKIQYPPNISYGYLLYMKREYLKPDYDPDAEIVKH